MGLFKLKYLLLLIVFSVSTSWSFGQEYCEFIGEISIDVAARGAFLACTRSANPAACTIAIAANSCAQDPACSGVVKKITEDGCNYTVKVVGAKMKIYGKALKSDMNELKRTYDALNSVDGIRWIEDAMLRY